MNALKCKISEKRGFLEKMRLVLIDELVDLVYN
jgi:hypothetical protein